MIALAVRVERASRLICGQRHGTPTAWSAAVPARTAEYGRIAVVILIDRERSHDPVSFDAFTGNIGTVIHHRIVSVSCLLQNAVVAFFNFAQRKAKLRAAHKITTYVAILTSHPCEVAACRENQQAARAIRPSDVVF